MAAAGCRPFATESKTGFAGVATHSSDRRATFLRAVGFMSTRDQGPACNFTILTTMKTTPLLTLGTLLATCWIAAAQTETPTPKHPHHPSGMSAAQMLQNFDKDSDSKLSLDELQAMQAAKAAQAAERRKEMRAKHDTDGDGKISLDEFKAMQAEQLAKFIKKEERRQAKPAKADTQGEAPLKHPKGRPGGKRGHGKPPVDPAVQ